MKRIITAIALTALAISSCTSDRQVDEYVDWLYSYMPLPDSTTYGREYWQANTRKTLEVRKAMKWDIPEREFKHFVLPVRVNNETLDDFRTIFADSLCARVKGMSMADAALEINHWCHERLTYRPSDGRTSSPIASIRSSWGRCGEESVLTVAALRATGLPARQVYTPRWAHTDDNHAWVEVYVDGKWYFMGACEPEPKLNMAWFNGPVSRAMLLHTKAFGDYQGDEDLIKGTECYNEINTICSYVPYGKTSVTVKDTEGNPVQDATVEFKIYNYAEYYTVARYQTDASGSASLMTGKGDMMVWAIKDGKWGLNKVNGEKNEVILEHRLGEAVSLDFDIVPPVEDSIPTDATAEDIAENNRRLAWEDSVRIARHFGNDVVIKGFRAAHKDNPAAEDLLASLSVKDMNDVSIYVLEDALAHCGGQFEKYRDCPRVELEFLLPYFAELSGCKGCETPESTAKWVKDNIRIRAERNPQNLRTSPIAVWNSRVTDPMGRDIFYVALCRANGHSARINEITGEVQYLQDDVWHTVKFGSEETKVSTASTGKLDVTIAPGTDKKDPLYYSHFTLANVSDGTCRLLTFDEDNEQPASKLFPMELEAGYYMLTSGTRMADGSVLSHVEMFNVTADKASKVSLLTRKPEQGLSVKGSFYADPMLEYTGRGFYAIAVLGQFDEPSKHAEISIEAASGKLNEWGRPIVIYGRDQIAKLNNAVYPEEDGKELAETLSAAMKQADWRLPVIAIADSFGRIVYFSSGYNTSLGDDLIRVIDQL